MQRAWPGALEFQEAVQTPEALGAETELGAATLVRNRHGLPVAYTGRFAAVFQFQAPTGESWAARCFTTQDALANRADRYQAIAETLAILPPALQALFVPFEYFQEGILLAGSWYPLVKMGWAEGTPLGTWVAQKNRRPRELRYIATLLGFLREDLQQAGVAHGDWQHDNILVSDDSRRVFFVDYDGMFVPALAHQRSNELGHPNYQHPQRTSQDFHPDLDRFACTSISVSLQALALAPELLHYCDNSLLLKKADYAAPQDSEIFQTLERLAERDPVLREDLTALWQLCGAEPQKKMHPSVPQTHTEPRKAKALWYAQAAEKEPELDPVGLPAPRTLAQYKAQLISVPAGEFVRGSTEQSDEFTRTTRLSLREFQLGRTPVTVAMYQEFVAANPSYKSAWAQRPGQMPLAPAGGVWNRRWLGLEAHPMVNVCWDDAQAFAVWAGMQLPTEAQWEKAARGGDGRRFPWGDTWSDSLCQCSKKAIGDSEGTAPVGSFPAGASPYGLLDMAGNVWEWCADWYQSDYFRHAPANDPTGPATGTERVLRGGSWRNVLAGDFRCANRERSHPTQKNILVGFRLASK